MNQRIRLLSFFVSFTFLCVVPFGSYAKDFWVEGNDRPQDRVNQKLRSLAPDSFLQVADRVDQAVVNISTTTTVQSPQMLFPWGGPQEKGQGPRGESPFGDLFDEKDFFRFFFGDRGQAPSREFQQRSLGSGFLLSPDGYLVTNNHVVAQADKIKVVLSDETEYEAKVVGTDKKTDVALLKIEPKKALRFVVLGDSDELKVGEVVVAIGNPFGLSHSVTQGIVSAKERSIGFGPYDEFIQTDASINPGNSGGPLLNLYGEVVGINTAIVATGQGIGFAIPVNLAKNILRNLKEKGKVVRGWLGVFIQEVSEEHAKALKLPGRAGALVTEVQKKSPAEKAGFKSGDVIVKFDGKAVENSRVLPLIVAETPVNQKVMVEIIRDAEMKVLKVEVGELDDETPKDSTAEKPEGEDQLGLAVDTLSSEHAKRLGLEPGTKGVLVQNVKPGSPADQKGVRRGDVIAEVNRKPTLSRSAYETETAKLRKGDTVLLLIKRQQGAAVYIAFTL